MGRSWSTAKPEARYGLSGKQLSRIKSEHLELPGPFGRRVAQPLDADAAGQATFYDGFDEVGGEEGKRDCQIDLPDAAFFASAKFGDVGHPT